MRDILLNKSPGKIRVKGCFDYYSHPDLGNVLNLANQLSKMTLRICFVLQRLDRIILKYIRGSANTSDTICECGRCLTYALDFPHFTIIIISGFSKTGPLSECMNVPWLELFFGPFYIRIKSLQPNLNRITVYCCISNLKMNKKVSNNPHMWLWFWFRSHLLFPSDYALGTMN